MMVSFLIYTGDFYKKTKWSGIGGDLTGDVGESPVAPLLSPELQSPLPLQFLAVRFVVRWLDFEAKGFDCFNIFAGLVGKVLIQFLGRHKDIPYVEGC